MKTKQPYYPVIIASILAVLLVFAIYPVCKYYIDPDATAYLTIVKRYARGDFMDAVNGYWSPWSCWLSAILVKGGGVPFESALVINTVGGLALLWVTHSIALSFHIQQRFLWFLSIAMAGFVGYAVYKQLFDDIWQCFFLLSSLRLYFHRGYLSKPQLWLLNGLLGALAYFSKAYALSFFIVNTVGCSYLLLKVQNRFSWSFFLKTVLVPCTVMFTLAAPWIYVLSVKYGHLTTATAGPLNLSWYLVGHPYFAEGINVLLPPPFINSPYYWEDPYLVNGPTPAFYSSTHLFLLQIVKSGYNFLKLINCMNELSALYLFTWMVGIYILFSKKRMLIADKKSKLLVFSFLLFPIPFILINYESRYIWYTMPLSLIIGMLSLQKLSTMFGISRHLSTFFAVMLSASYLFWPVWDTRTMATYGKEPYRISELLNKSGFKGSFAISSNNSPEVRFATQIAYHTGNQYYNMPFMAEFKDILKDMRRYHVKYYLHHFNNADPTPIVLLDEKGKPFKELNIITSYGWKIFVITE